MSVLYLQIILIGIHVIFGHIIIIITYFFFISYFIV